jgi:hypothetical protein
LDFVDDNQRAVTIDPFGQNFKIRTLFSVLEIEPSEVTLLFLKAIREVLVLRFQRPTFFKIACMVGMLVGGQSLLRRFAHADVGKKAEHKKNACDWHGLLNGNLSWYFKSWFANRQ